MNDPTPPSGDRKPRRRAPRKRAPAPRVEKPEGDAPATPVAAGPAARDPATPTPIPPTPIPPAAKRPSRAKKARGTRPAADAAHIDATASAGVTDEVAPAKDEAPSPPPSPRPRPARADHTGASGAAPAPAAAINPADAGPPQPSAEPRDVSGIDGTPEARVDRSAPVEAPAVPAPAATPAVPDLTPPSLRPGELIRVPLSVRWRDLDAFNHVNNSKYLSYLEEARLRWMLTMPGMGLDENVAPVVAASNLNYRRPIGWPGEVVVELFVERLGNSSVTIGHRIVDVSEGGVTYCDGHVVMVWIDQASGRAAPLPAAVRAACSRR